MIWGILGETGDGKTAYLAWLGYNAFLAGSRIHSNFHLTYPHHYISSTGELKDIPLEGNRLIMLDELWLTGDAYESQNRMVRKLAEFVLQARKKDADVIHTNQHETQVVKRIRINTSLFLKPRITLSYIEKEHLFTFDKPHPNKGIVPYLMSVRFYDKFMTYLNYDETFVVYPAHLYYNTREEMAEIRSIDYDKIAEKYADFEGSRTELASCLVRIDHLGEKDASGFATYLQTLKANEYLREFVSKPLPKPGVKGK